MLISQIWILSINIASVLATPWSIENEIQRRQPPNDGSSPGDSSESISDDESVLQDHGDYITCNQAWYGNPSLNDCDQAIGLLPGALARGDTFREFIGILGPLAPRPAPGLDGPPIQTPVMRTHGTCTVVVVLPANVNTARNVIVNMKRMHHAAVWLVDKCPGGGGSGGRFYHDPRTRADYLAANGYQLPEIVVFGRSSLAQSVLDNKISCSLNSKRDAKCRFRERAFDFLSRLPKPPLHTRPKSKDSGAGRKASCSGSCHDQSECNIDSNCICASGLDSSPLSNTLTWGSHACTYVASATFAMAQTKGRGGACARGRCLLESDGTLDIAADGNLIHSKNVTDSSDLNPFANISSSDIEKLAEAYQAAANLSSTSNFSTLTTDTINNPTSSNQPQPLPTSTISYEAAPTPSLDSDGYILPDVNSTILNCPCNCTYVSPSCCLTKDVREASAAQVQMAPLPASATVSCDESTGAWVPKSAPSGAAGANDTEIEPDQLGKAPYSPSTEMPWLSGDEGA